MFAFCFALVILINLSVNVQTTPSHSGKTDTVALFGQLHHMLANQPKLSCYRVRPNIKNPHPIDSTKYVVCHDEHRYEIFTCPNGGVFNNTQKACLDLCQQNDPCLNQGQCIILPDLTKQCVCRRDWTGERCETPLSSCAYNPCGPDGECRMLKAGDYSQDYVCICNRQQSYGRNCQQTVPNPCRSQVQQQFHPFAYSRRAYINCDDELIFFQPCNANLYWNQEYKRCDRELPLLLRAPFTDLKWRSQQTNDGTSKVFHLTGFSSKNRVDTTTVPPQIFRLSGFSSNNVQQQNDQFQDSENFQPWSVEQNKRTWTPDQSTGSANGINNQNSRQWASSSSETTNNVPSGFTVRFLPGWQSKQQQN